MRSAKAFLIGFGAAYLFDPNQGRRRRTVARARVLSSFGGRRDLVRRKLASPEGACEG